MEHDAHRRLMHAFSERQDLVRKFLFIAGVQLRWTTEELDDFCECYILRDRSIGELFWNEFSEVQARKGDNGLEDYLAQLHEKLSSSLESARFAAFLRVIGGVFMRAFRKTPVSFDKY